MSKYTTQRRQREIPQIPYIAEGGITYPKVHYYVNQDGPTTEDDADYQLTFFDTEIPPEGYRYGFEDTGLAAHVCEYTGDSDVEKIAMPYPYRYSLIDVSTECPIFSSDPTYAGCPEWFTGISDALTSLNLTGVDGFTLFNGSGSGPSSIPGFPVSSQSLPNLQATPEVHEDFMYYLTRRLAPYPEHAETTLRIPPSHKTWEEGTLEYLLNYVLRANLFKYHKCGEDALMERFEKILEVILPLFEVNHFEYAATMGSAMETLTLLGTPKQLFPFRPPVKIKINLSLLALTELIDAAK